MSKKRKVLLIIVAIIVISASVAGGAFAYSKFFVKPESKSEQPKTETQMQIQLTPEATTQPTVTVTPPTTAAPKATTPAPQAPTTSTPTPAPDNKICEDQKAVLVASIDTIYNGKIYTENTQHQANLDRIAQDYSNRGLLRSGAYTQAIDAENAAHQVRLNDIDAWYNIQLVQIDQSC